MRGLDELGAAGALAPHAPPLPGETVLIIAKVCDRPGMVAEPKIGVAEPSALARGVWVEFGMRGLTYKVWVPFVDEGKTVCMPLAQLAFRLQT